MSIAHCRKNNASNAQYPLLICCHSFSPAVSLKITDRSFRYASHRLWIYSVSLTTLVSIHLIIHFSTHLPHHPHSRHPSLLHSFTPGSKPTFSTNPFHRKFILPTGLPHDNGTGPDLSRSSFCFQFHILIFLFIPCGRLSWLPGSFVKSIISYRMITLLTP